MTSKIPVKKLMERNFAVLGYGAPLKVAAQRLLHGRADAVVIRHDDGRLVGLLSERDLVFAAQAIAEGHVDLVGNYANRKFITVAETDLLDRALQRMAKANFHRAVVIDDDSIPAGILSLKLPPLRTEKTESRVIETPTTEEVPA
ncbi:MAG: CBS domain-containing protein [Myxococcaceae bacterium]